MLHSKADSYQSGRLFGGDDGKAAWLVVPKPVAQEQAYLTIVQLGTHPLGFVKQIKHGSQIVLL